MDWKDNLIKIAPYVAGEQPDKKDFIKLNANENPYPPAPGVIKAIEGFRGSKHIDGWTLPCPWVKELWEK